MVAVELRGAVPHRPRGRGGKNRRRRSRGSQTGSARGAGWVGRGVFKPRPSRPRSREQHPPLLLHNLGPSPLFPTHAALFAARLRAGGGREEPHRRGYGAPRSCGACPFPSVGQQGDGRAVCEDRPRGGGGWWWWWWWKKERRVPHPFPFPFPFARHGAGRHGQGGFPLGGHLDRPRAHLCLGGAGEKERKRGGGFEERSARMTCVCV